MSVHVFGKGWTGRPCRGVSLLLAIIVGAFIAEKLLGIPKKTTLEIFALSRDGLMEGRWWQLLGHALIHDGWFHLSVNMLALWFAGRRLEPLLGTARFLVLFLVATAGGGFLQVLLGPPNADLIGASSGVSGVVVAFSAAFPNLWLTFLFLRLRAKYLGWGIFGASLFFVLTGWQREIGNAAHLGGCIAGYLLLRIYGYGGSPNPLSRISASDSRPRK